MSRMTSEGRSDPLQCLSRAAITSFLSGRFAKASASTVEARWSMWCLRTKSSMSLSGAIEAPDPPTPPARWS
eukprot:4857742-Pyramimonas_sp.AAC.1